MARFVPGHYVTPKTTPQWWLSGAYGTPRRRYEKPHYVDRYGHWVAKPGARTPTVITDKPGIPDLPGGGNRYGLNDAELMRRANALADSQIGSKLAAIERARAAAMAQAQRDAATYQGLGSAQMQMIGQIPANIQGIRDTAAQAMASTAGQVAGAQVQQATAEQAANAAFTASQTGGTALAAPDPGGVNAQGAAAAVEALGGTIPAQSQVEIGGASAIAASGMPAVVARATQDQVAMRMSQAATEDADYRQQLIDAAAERGGIYEDALSNLYDIETKKFGLEEAKRKAEQDQRDFEYKKQQDALAYRQWRQEFALKKQQQLAAEVLARTKTKAQAAKEMRAWNLQQDRLAVQQGYLDLAKGKAGADYYTDAQGRTVPKGYRYNAAGELVDIPAPVRPAKPRAPKPKSQVVSWANNRADAIATTNAQPTSEKGGHPRVRQLATVSQIVDEIGPELRKYGYTEPQILALARKAASRHYARYVPGSKNYTKPSSLGTYR